MRKQLAFMFVSGFQKVCLKGQLKLYVKLHAVFKLQTDFISIHKFFRFCSSYSLSVPLWEGMSQHSCWSRSTHIVKLVN